MSERNIDSLRMPAIERVFVYLPLRPRCRGDVRQARARAHAADRPLIRHLKNSDCVVALDELGGAACGTRRGGRNPTEPQIRQGVSLRGQLHPWE